MSKPHSNTPDEMSPHEADTLRDRASMSDDAIRTVEGRRGFLKSAAAGIAGLGVLLKGGDANGQTTSVDDILGSKAAEDQKEIDEHNEEEEKKTGANKKVVGHAIDGLIEVVAHYGTQYAAKEGIGGLVMAKGAKAKATTSAEKKLGAIQRNAQDKTLDTPDADTVKEALVRIKTSMENKMENTYVQKEYLKDMGLLADWIIWFLRESNATGQANPVSGQIGGQIARACIAYSTIFKAGIILFPSDKKETRIRKAKEHGKESAGELYDKIERTSRAVTLAIGKANKATGDDEKVAAGKEAKKEKDAERAESDRQTEKREGVRRQHELDLQGMRDTTELGKERLRTAAATGQADKDRDALTATADADRADAQLVRDEEATKLVQEADRVRLAGEEQARQDAFDTKRASRGKIVGADVDDPDAYQGLGLTDQQITDYIEAAIRKERGA